MISRWEGVPEHPAEAGKKRRETSMIELFESFALTLDEHRIWSHLLLD